MQQGKHYKAHKSFLSHFSGLSLKKSMVELAKKPICMVPIDYTTHNISCSRIFMTKIKSYNSLFIKLRRFYSKHRTFALS